MTQVKHSLGFPGRFTPPLLLDYSSSSNANLTWRYAADRLFWQTIGLVPSSCTGPSCLNGRLWTHGDTDVGQTLASTNLGISVGLHDPSNVGLHSLANYYFDEQPDAPVAEVIPGVGVLPRQKVFFRTPVDPLENERDVPSWQVFERGAAISLFTVGNQIVGLRKTSALVDASPSLGSSLASELRGNGQWINAPGPTTTSALRPMALEISSDGTAAIATANLVNGKLLLGRNIELVAQPSADADDDIGASATATIPAQLPVVSGNAGNGTAVLTLRAQEASQTSAGLHTDAIATVVTCSYSGGSSTEHPKTADDRAAGQAYLFASCSNGARPGDALVVQGANLQVLSGDGYSGATRVEAALNVTEVAGSNLGTRSRSHHDCGHANSPRRPRRNFVATYAPTLNGIFVAGGASIWGETMSDVWFKPLDGSWRQLPLASGTVGHVIDAAFSQTDGRLWILDEADEAAPNVGRWSCHHQRTRRLLRIEPELGGIEVVASAPMVTSVSEHGLLTDRDGQILLYSSNNRTGTHRIGRLEPSFGSFVASLTPSLSGSLAYTPVVDSRGYSFIEPAPRGSTHGLKMDRVASLPLTAATLTSWSELLQ